MRLPLTVCVQRYKDHLYAAAFSVCRNPQDAEDVIWDAFLAYHQATKEFEDEQHIRAWLLRVTINKAKNIVISFWRRNRVSLEDYTETLAFEEPSDQTLFETVLHLPEKYRIVIHLHYYEGYRVEEIAGIIGTRPGTVKSRLSRARKLLKEKLKEEWDDDESREI